MASYNRVILIGNLTRDPELRHIPSGTPVAEITVAVNDRVKRNDQWIDEPTFVDVTLWSRMAELANEYLSKGSPVMIEGRLKYDSWEKDGQKRSKLRVIGERMQFLGSRSDGGGGSRSAPPRGRSTAGGEDPVPSYDDDFDQTPANAGPPMDDIPF